MKNYKIKNDDIQVRCVRDCSENPPDALIGRLKRKARPEALRRARPIMQFIAAFMIVSMIGCKPTSQNFSYQRTVNFNFFHLITGILGDSSAKIDSVKIYRAVMEERLVERDATTEYKLINTESTQETVDLQISKNYDHLFLMQIFTTPTQDDLIIFLSTGYSPNGLCTHIGPAYLGNIRIYQVDIKRELKIKRHKDIYWLDDKARKDMNIIAFDDLPEPDDRTSLIKIKQIILQEDNKIGGNKPILFTTEKIFNDTNALAFKYFETIKK